MKTIYTATTLGKLTLGATFVLALAVSSRAHAAATFDVAMNQGVAAYQAQNFDNAAAWFNYASALRPNDRNAQAWSANAEAYRNARVVQRTAVKNYTNRTKPQYPGSAGQTSQNT